MNKKFLFIPTLLLATASSMNLWASDTNEGMTYWGWAGPCTQPTEQEIAANKRLLQSFIDDTERAKITRPSQQAKEHITTAIKKAHEVDQIGENILTLLEQNLSHEDTIAIHNKKNTAIKILEQRIANIEAHMHQKES